MKIYSINKRASLRAYGKADALLIGYDARYGEKALSVDLNQGYRIHITPADVAELQKALEIYKEHFGK